MPTIEELEVVDAAQEADTPAYEQEVTALKTALSRDGRRCEVVSASRTAEHMQLSTRPGEVATCSEQLAKQCRSNRIMSDNRWTEALADFEGGHTPIGVANGTLVPLPRPLDVVRPYRNVASFEDQTSFKLRRAEGVVGFLKDASAECQYVPRDSMPCKNLDDEGKAVRTSEPSKVITWAGTSAYIEAGRASTTEYEALRSSVPVSDVMQTKMLEPVSVPVAKKLKHRLSDEACPAITGNVAKKRPSNAENRVVRSRRRLALPLA